jgi:hypothetical protein
LSSNRLALLINHESLIIYQEKEKITTLDKIARVAWIISSLVAVNTHRGVPWWSLELTWPVADKEKFPLPRTFFFIFFLFSYFFPTVGTFFSTLDQTTNQSPSPANHHLQLLLLSLVPI